ncbi:hypothetical protein F383_39181 [Gossypium arboreum]|uniref:Uncharacterized protein n=1 Tax=Gossypium arboreum TaxID=29729 RepID=A0A0B0MNJ9_GOSAR|nr:hypothetical protein F383_39181 [Gossypium arboreum]
MFIGKRSKITDLTFLCLQ